MKKNKIQKILINRETDPFANVASFREGVNGDSFILSLSEIIEMEKNYILRS